MVRSVCRDIIFLGRVCKPAAPADLPIALDLADTLRANAGSCVGMAANMIGADKCIIAFFDGGQVTLMFNPEITACSGQFETEEGCLSLDGVRPTARYRNITVRYQDEGFRTRTKAYTGFTAQIIQHEIDHCRGRII